MSSRHLAVALVIGLLIGAGVTYALVAPRLSKKTTVTTNSAQDVMDAYAAHLQSIRSENMSALAAEYENNATVKLSGVVIGYGGEYESATNVSLLHRSIFSSLFVTVNLANESNLVYVSGNGQEAIVDSNFTMYGSGYPICAESCSIAAYVTNIGASVSYDRVGGNWLISSETWDFLAYAACATLSNPDCSELLTS
jgi:hypothetical protein